MAGASPRSAPGAGSPAGPVHAYEFDPGRAEAFIRLGAALHAGRPDRIPPVPGTIARELAPGFSFYARPGTRHRRFVVETAGGMQGHVQATVDHGLRDADGVPVGTLGFFECVDDWSVAEDLLGAATAWLRAEGVRARIWAPMDFDIWHGYRFMVRGFDRAPFFGEPRNPPRYPEIFGRFGFAVRKTWCSLELRGREAIAAAAVPHEAAHAAAVAAGYRFTTLGPEAAASEVIDLHATAMQALGRSFGFTRCPVEEYAALFAAYARVLRPLFAILMRDGQGAAEGYAIAFPDVVAGRAVFHSIGVVPGARRRGLGRALFHRTVRELVDAGSTDLVIALVADDSPGRGLIGDAVRGAQREYAMFQLGT